MPIRGGCHATKDVVPVSGQRPPEFEEIAQALRPKPATPRRPGLTAPFPDPILYHMVYY